MRDREDAILIENLKAELLNATRSADNLFIEKSNLENQLSECRAECAKLRNDLDGERDCVLRQQRALNRTHEFKCFACGAINEFEACAARTRGG
jgi:hypothetical protein